MAIKDKELYKGRKIKQVKGVVKIFDSFFTKEKFDNIIEIGSGTGAFSIYFASKAKDMKASFITCDLKPLGSKIVKELKFFGAIIMTGDVNKNHEIEKVTSNSGRCLILNDGGLKVPQFLRFAKILKPKDIILTHDYYCNGESSAGGIVVVKDVKKCIEINGLQVMDEVIFDKYLWLCVEKK